MAKSAKTEASATKDTEQEVKDVKTAESQEVKVPETEKSKAPEEAKGPEKKKAEKSNTSNGTKKETKSAKKEVANTEIPENVDKLMKLYPQYEEIYVTPQGFVHTKDATEYLLKDAVLYKNKYYKQ